MSVKKMFLFILVLVIVMPSLWAQPMKKIPIGGPRKSCGRDLVARVDRICQSRGGHMTYTRARRVRRGIVEECCANKCSDHHIYAYCSKSSDSDTSMERPIPIEVIEPKFHEVRSVPVIMPDIPTEAPVEKVTPDTPLSHYRYNDIYVKDNVNADFVEQIIKSLPSHSNDFQVGTVPPEFRSSRYIPSRVRISNY